MEQYQTEEEQLEALRRWWNENGRGILTAILFAVAGGFGWQAWQSHQLQQEEQASDLYQMFLLAAEEGGNPDATAQRTELAGQLTNDYSGSAYAQFAALRLAAIAANEGNLTDAEGNLRWVLGKAPKGSDVAQVAQLRLGRVLASLGDSEQALAILGEGDAGAYGASYAAARGDILLVAGRNDEAAQAYEQALILASGDRQGVNLPALQQKLQSLTPVPARALDQSESTVPEVVTPAPDTNQASDGVEE